MIQKSSIDSYGQKRVHFNQKIQPKDYDIQHEHTLSHFGHAMFRRRRWHVYLGPTFAHLICFGMTPGGDIADMENIATKLLISLG